MLSLPSKPWKKVRIEPIGEDLYRLTFVKPLPSIREFEKTVQDLEGIISGGEKVVHKDADGRQLQVHIKDLKVFQRRLVFFNIFIVQEES